MYLFPLTPGGAEGRRIVETGIKAAEANGGLVWERYLPLWSGDVRRPQHKGGDDKGSGNATKQALDRFVQDRHRVRKEGEPWLREHGARQRRALDHLAQRSGKVLKIIEARTQARFATGLGADHPTENGFSFDPASGLPFLPGSALKGLCRRAASLEGRDEHTCVRWFGPERIMASSQARQGEVAFFDAFPTQWPRLAIDIVNNHHSAYYRAGAEKNDSRRKHPTETENPVPVYFLTVDKGAVFSIPLLAPPGEADAVAEALLSGLRWLGLGAKTAVGYGLMEGTVGE